MNANIPEETAWYKERFAGDWKYVSAALLFGNFVIPFFGLLSRHVKRHRRGLAMGAMWILIVHWVDLYWLVMPSLSPEHPPLHALDFTCLLGIGGLFIAGAAFQAKRRNLVPLKDPRLQQSLAFENI